MNKIDKLREIINNSNNIVAFVGAGLSTESGIKDFRGKNGLYMDTTFDDDPEYLLSNYCFYTETDKFYNYYKHTFNCLDIKPNYAHKYLKKLEELGKLKAVITQNIDGLTRDINNVYEIHGTIYKNYCLKCKKEYGPEKVFNSKGIPKCSCGGLIKPSVVLYGEQLPQDAYIGGIEAIEKADTLLVLGSSLTVYPAAGMIDYFHGKNLVIINYDKTNSDYKANLVINDSIVKTFKELEK